MERDRLSQIFAALADPTRRAMLARLLEGDATVTELAEPFDLSQPTISKHLKVLERAGLVSRGRDAQRRPCRLEARPLKAAADWLAAYRDYWEESYQRLDALLAEMRNDAEPRDDAETRIEAQAHAEAETPYEAQARDKAETRDDAKRERP